MGDHIVDSAVKRLFRGRYRVDTVRLKGYDYGQPGPYFFTICTKGRKRLFGEVRSGFMGLNEAGCIAYACWAEIPDHFPHVELDAFIVMPNHVHALITLMPGDGAGGGRDADGPVAEVWHATPLRRRRVDRTVGHPSPPAAGSLAVVVRSYKSAVTRLARQRDRTFAWQARYHDRVVRNDRERAAIYAYILDNPRQWHADRFWRDGRLI